jgi:hypothetical protein
MAKEGGGQHSILNNRLKSQSRKSTSQKDAEKTLFFGKTLFAKLPTAERLHLNGFHVSARG